MKSSLKIRVWMIVLVGLWSVSPLFASDFKNVGHSGANFLQIPVEPAGAALGNSYVAMAQGVDGLYWNPAAVSFTKGTEVLLSTADWILDTRLAHVGISRKLGSRTAIGLQATSFSMGEMEITTPFQPNGTGENFDAGNYVIGATYAMQLTDHFAFGASIKYVYEYIWEANSAVVAFDFGSYYQTAFYNLRIGMCISNFGGSMEMAGDPIENRLAEELAVEEQNNPRLQRLSSEYTLPQYFNVGIAFDPYRSEDYRITISSTANDPNDNQSRVSFGSEFALKEKVMLRAGFKQGYEEQRFSMGIGMVLNIGSVHARFDYGFSEFGILDNIHYLSMRFGF
ncbi:PorV/PorQ family protein [candidate division KSB1 bacterium]|nr:PorV/PorQ family protein [candidate division KSB1 bacterium]